MLWNAPPIVIINLFFVANLATFTANHEIVDSSSLKNYLGFFTLLWFARGEPELVAELTRWKTQAAGRPAVVTEYFYSPPGYVGSDPLKFLLRQQLKFLRSRRDSEAWIRHMGSLVEGIFDNQQFSYWVSASGSSWVESTLKSICQNEQYSLRHTCPWIPKIISDFTSYRDSDTSTLRLTGSISTYAPSIIASLAKSELGD